MIQSNIKADLKTAMKAKDTARVSFLRVVISEFDRVGKELSDDEAVKVLRKMRKDAEEMKNNEEISILDTYLPQLMSEAEIKAKIDEILEEVDISNIAAPFGRMMGEFNKRCKGKADNKLVSKLVKEKLNDGK